MNKVKFLLLLLLVCGLMQLSAIAEESEVVPPIALDPGVVNKLDQDQIKELSTPELEPEKEECEGLEISKEILKRNSAEHNVGFVKAAPFQLDKVVFVGNTVFKEKDLNKPFSSLFGKTISVEDALAATNEISKIYYAKGYLTSYAYINPKDIKDNTLVVHIVEGKIGEISIEGNTRSKEGYLKNAVLASNKLQEGKIFNVNDAKACLENINSKRFMKGQISVEKSEKTDTSEIKLKVDEKLPISFNVMWDNDGNGLVGEQRAILLLSDNNLFGLGHSIYGGTVLAQGTEGFLAGYKMPVGKHGTELQFDYSFAHVNLGGEQEANRISGNAQKFSTRVVQPLYNKNNINLTTDLGIDFINATSMSYSENESLGDYNLTVVRHGLNFKRYDKTGLVAARYESSFGIPFLGATGSTSRYFGNDENTDSQSAFYKFKLDLMRLQKLPKQCLGIVRISTQYSPNNLYPTEQMNFGGVTTIRGYEPGACLADSGVNGTFEIRTPVPFLKEAMPNKYENLSERVKLGFFYDWGVFSQQNSGVRMNGVSNFLQSVGAGIHFKITDTMLASFQLGIPVGDSIYKEKSAMFQFAIRADVWDIFAKKPKIQEL